MSPMKAMLLATPARVPVTAHLRLKTQMPWKQLRNGLAKIPSSRLEVVVMTIPVRQLGVRPLSLWSPNIPRVIVL